MATDPLARPLPNNPDAERSVLGAVLLDNKALAAVTDKLKTSDFFTDAHRRIFAIMLAMHDAGKPIDTLSMTEALYGKGEIEAAGGTGYVNSLVDGMPRAPLSHVAHYAEIIREKSQLRRIITAAGQIQQKAFSDLAASSDLIEQLRTSITPATNGSTNGDELGAHCYTLMDFLKTQFPPPEHLIEGIIPRGGTVLIVALPHRMKSWFTTSLALASSTAGKALGVLEVKKPVRTLLIQVEDFPGVLQWRMNELLRTADFGNITPGNVRVIPRCGLNLPNEKWYQWLYKQASEFQADHVIMDVVRRIFRGDINGPQDTAAFLEQIDRLREATQCAVTLVHHENKKDAEIMTAAAGSYNLPGWANVMIQFKRKTQEGHLTHVEIEVDNKLAQSPEPMRMVLDLTSQVPVRIEALGEGDSDFRDAVDQLGSEWTLRDLREALDISKTSAHRRLKKWIIDGRVEKIMGGKHGPRGGMARYRVIDTNP